MFAFLNIYILIFASCLRHTAVVCHNWVFLFAIFILSTLDLIVLNNRRFWCTTGQWLMSQLHYSSCLTIVSLSIAICDILSRQSKIKHSFLCWTLKFVQEFSWTVNKDSKCNFNCYF